MWAVREIGYHDRSQVAATWTVDAGTVAEEGRRLASFLGDGESRQVRVTESE